MAASINRVTLIGNLGTDPSARIALSSRIASLLTSRALTPTLIVHGSRCSPHHLFAPSLTPRTRE